MTRDNFITVMDRSLKLIRIEFNLTQDKMALALGISKKTLVEIEKERRSLGWSGAVGLASIFRDSSVLQNQFGGELGDLVIALAFEDLEVSYPRTMGGKIWWTTEEEAGGWRIQRNIISGHYRLLDNENCRRISSFDLKTVQNFWNQSIAKSQKPESIED